MENLVKIHSGSPRLGGGCFVASNAVLIGDVTCGEHCSFWFSSVTRGDVGKILIGSYCNIQDGAIVHCTFEKSSTVIGDNVSVGHNAVVHGSTIGSHVLIGMTAVILDGAVIEDYCIVGAGSVVLENTVCEAGFLYAGTPAKKIKLLSDPQRRSLEITPKNYVMYASWFTNREV